MANHKVSFIRKNCFLTTDQKNGVLLGLGRIIGTRESEILSANDLDVERLRASSNLKQDSAFLDRLRLNGARIQAIQKELLEIAALADPVGEVVRESVLSNGLRTRQVRSPLGSILVIFESRPNVAIDAFALAFKSGNRVTLKGGKECRETLKVLYACIQTALRDAGIASDFCQGLVDLSRADLVTYLQDSKKYDVVIPRGGEGLIRFVTENARIPIIKNDRGMCHLYVHEDADLEMAAGILLNGKAQRPGVCNALETVLIHESVLQSALSRFEKALSPFQLLYYADARSYTVLQRLGVPSDRLRPATPESFDHEYLDLILNVAVVSSLEEAIEHIHGHGSRHSEAIVTASEMTARQFQNAVDAAVVYWNASTRFTDGNQLGLGAEIGISTQKLHVRGPVGLQALTSVRWLIDGSGQVRS